jgi:hypothetical protein
VKSVIAMVVIMAALSAAAAQSPTPPDVPPAAVCVKPETPKLGVPGNEQSAINAYNARIAKYNRESVAFTRCTNDYIQYTNGEIQKIRNDANDRIKFVTDSANRQTKDIDAKIRAAMAGTVLAGGSQLGFPPSECHNPDDTLLKSKTGKSDIARTNRYDEQKRAYEPCMRTYIEQARGEIQQVQANAQAALALIADDANTRIRLLNGKVGDARSTADDAAREGAQSMDELRALTIAPGEANLVTAYPRPPRSADSPKGNGYPDAIACRAPQIQPDSRLLGPEVCRRNRDWAQLFHDGSDISADGLRIVDSERRRTQNAVHCTAGNVFCGP